MYGRKKYIPILAIVGFLGSGKTTLLNHLLKNQSGYKIGVIVNDFGQVNIDSMLVARQTDQQLELSNGCICCTLEGNSLDDAIGQLAHAGSSIDFIVIEASGLAEPKELLRLLMSSKNAYARFDGLISVIDAGQIMDTNEKHPGFVEQLMLADIAILNKTDLISAKKSKDIEGYLRFINPSIHLIKTTHGAVAPDLLFGTTTKKTSTQLSLGHDEHHDDHLHASYKTESFTTAKPIDPQKWEVFQSQIDKTIFRAKGFLFFGMKGLGQKYVYQKVGNRTEMKLDEWLNETPSTNLVFIGTDFDSAKLRSSLEALEDDNPDNLTNETIMDVLKYR